MSPTGRILVVDDEDPIREVVSMVLEDEGYEVVTAPHGAAALGQIRRARPDAILLDMRMPVMDGWQFARAYRQLPGPHAPIIVVTAAQHAARWAAEVKADGYVAKPFDLPHLLDVVGRYAH